MSAQNEVVYGRWREDKEAVPGFSKELISADYDMYIKNETSVDELYALPFPGENTILKSLMRLKNTIGDRDFLGTRVGDHYEWRTVTETMDEAHYLSLGFKALGLIPDIEAEDRSWRFMGIQAKNRAEWAITSFAGMHQKTTIIGMYDTLGPDAVRFIVNQTKMTSIAIAPEYIKKLCQIKLDDQDGKMSTLANLVVFED